MAGRRLVKVLVATEDIECLVRHGAMVRRWVTNGIPEDARFFGISYDDINLNLWVIYEHESFPETPEGGVVPMFSVEHVDLGHVTPEVLARL